MPNARREAPSEAIDDRDLSELMFAVSELESFFVATDDRSRAATPSAGLPKIQETQDASIAQDFAEERAQISWLKAELSETIAKRRTLEAEESADGRIFAAFERIDPETVIARIEILQAEPEDFSAINDSLCVLPEARPIEEEMTVLNQWLCLYEMEINLSETIVVAEAQLDRVLPEACQSRSTTPQRTAHS